MKDDTVAGESRYWILMCLLIPYNFVDSWTAVCIPVDVPMHVLFLWKSGRNGLL